VSDRLARDAGPSIAAGNVDALHQLAEQMSAQNAVTYVRFFDAGGLLLVSVGSVPGGTAPPIAQPDGRVAGPIPIGSDTWEFQAPAFIGVERVGIATVGVSLDALAEIRRQTFTTAGVFTALFSLAAVLGALLLARAITRPLHVLAGAADTIARGDFATRVPVGSRDEVGALAISFNAMAESLADSRTSLEEKLAELERANHLKSEFLATISLSCARR
jgi:HAMP domain-containing protein